MAHGLAFFKARELVDKAEGALKLIDVDHGGDDGGQVEAAQEVLRVVLENQIRIAETLELIKQEFDKFEEGIGKIL